ncbi:hypothetical protein PP187_gp319 [Klebsiella phage vB_KvM-Eowyn]|uniref:Uncharacterized protein n=1 Tax=Klebsiella phage vB_KvM-Eowyn TaxID=2762819 RepID=A0A7R8MJS5_9CAUD|nr:hypothetical protein PP187_gp319 [Klebsiella phage vB_KvM-Eowyn]CAD5236308.1 hypothetical protein LLCLJKAH_00319 [Klebsiella phage vB_KvM-Eowyn]
MKYIWLLLVTVTCNVFARPDYPDVNRFVQYNVPNTAAYIIVDTKTGCEYISNSGEGATWSLLQGTCKIPEEKK